MENILLSVIIPVYNVSAYIENSLSSLVRENYEQVEYILIDDGSTDDSGIICDAYAKKYNNIYVKHKKNGGVSSARNVGLQLARGKYIAWVDPDDFVSKYWLSTIMKSIEEKKPDCILFDYYEKWQKKTIKKILPYSKYVKKKVFLYDLSADDTVHSFLFTKVIKKKFYVNKFFDEHSKIYEDYKMISEIAIELTNIIYISQPLYTYVHRYGSLTNQWTMEKYKIATEAALHRINLFKRLGYNVDMASIWRIYIPACVVYDAKDKNNEIFFCRCHDEIYHNWRKILCSKHLTMKFKITAIMIRFCKHRFYHTLYSKFII